MRNNRITHFLATRHQAALTLWAMVAAFSAYGCMYAFRRPISVAKFADMQAWGLDYKTTVTLAQLIGYTISKFLGIRFVSEALPSQRIAAISVLIGVSELALLAFAIAPLPWNVLCLLMNGLPLGMVWGLIIFFVEGRRVTELLGLGLSVSVIFASGWVKSAGAWTMNYWGISELWMPFVTGALFIGPLIVSIWMLAQLPPPSASDVAQRSLRMPMDKAARRVFVTRHRAGIILIVSAYVALLIYRDLRDTFMVTILSERGVIVQAGDFAVIENRVGVGILLLLSVLALFQSNRTALLANATFISSGAVIIGVSTFLHVHGWLSAMTWIVATGIGVYLGFIPFQGIFFDRLLAVLKSPGTSVFLTAVSESYGYMATVLLYLFKAASPSQMSASSMLIDFSYLIALLLPLCLFVGVFHLAKSETSDRLSCN
jgi:hypothetical protein